MVMVVGEGLETTLETGELHLGEMSVEEVVVEGIEVVAEESRCADQGDGVVAETVVLAEAATEVTVAEFEQPGLLLGHAQSIPQFGANALEGLPHRVQSFTPTEYFSL